MLFVISPQDLQTLPELSFLCTFGHGTPALLKMMLYPSEFELLAE
jgi:hypothetical protein